MSLTATSLQKKANTGQIREEVANIVKTLDGVIATAHEQRMSSVTHEMPINFSISNLKLIDAQRIIYALVIEDLEKRGFSVKIRLSAKSTFINISWVSVFDEDEIRRLSDIIKSHLVVNADKQ